MDGKIRELKMIARAFGIYCVLLILGFCAFSWRVRAQEKPQDAPATPNTQSPAPSGDVITSGTVIKKESRLVLVDAVVTDKKGKYVRDLTQGELRVYEDNKEQPLTSFSSGTSQDAGPNSNQKHYLVLFFDNSSMEAPDQIPARAAATKFIEANAGPNNLMAVVEFGGALRILQNFT